MKKQTLRDVLITLCRLHPAVQKKDGTPNQNALAEVTGIPQPTIQRILSGEHENPRGDTVERLARYFKVSLAQMRGEQSLLFDIKGGKNFEVLEITGSLGQVPLISLVRAGTWMEAVDTYPVGIGEELIEYTVPLGPRGFAVRVQGDSMVSPHGDPSFPEGMIITVDPDAEPRHRSFVIAKLHSTNEATFKQLVIDGPHRYLRPLNDRYPQISLTDDTIIVGVVREAILRRRFD